MNGYEGHRESVGAAQSELEELRNLVHLANEKREQVVGVVINAVGENPGTESGGNALTAIIEVGTLLDNVLGLCNVATTELERYGSGF